MNTFEQFSQSYANQKWQDCLAAVPAVLETFDDLPDADKIQFYASWGQALRYTKQHEQAAEKFEWLCQHFPNAPEGLDGLSNIARDLKDWQKSVEYALQYQQKFPEHWEGCWWLGHAYKNLQQFEQADYWFLQLIERFPEKYQGIEGLVNVAEVQQNWQEMENRTRVFQQHFPDMWQSLFWFGVAAKNLGRLADAERYFSELVEKRPNLSKVWEELVLLAKEQCDWVLMAKRAEAFKQRFPKMWQGYWWLGLSQKECYQYDTARAEFETLQKQFPKQSQGWQGMVDLAKHQNNDELAFQAASDFTAKFPNMWQGYWWQGQACIRLYRYEQALSFFTQLQQNFPDAHQGYEGVVNIAQHMQDWQTVVGLSQSFQHRFPKMYQGYWWQGQAHTQLAQYTQAQSVFLSLKVNFPQDFHYMSGLINIMTVKNDWQTALRVSKRATELFPNHLPFYRSVGYALLAQGQMREAEDYFVDLAKQFPNEFMPIIGLADVHSKSLQHAKAISVLQHGLLKFPHSEPIAQNLVREHLAQNEIDEAVTVFENYIASPLSAKNQLIWADIVRAKQGNLAWIEKLADLHQQFPFDWDIALNYINHATVHIAFDDVDSPHQPEKMLRLMESLAQQQPFNQRIRLNLIRLYVKFGKNVEALKLIGQLPHQHASSQYLRLYAWEAHEQQNLELEWKLWQEIITKEHFPELLPKGNELLYRSLKKLQLNKYDLPLFALARNEMLRLPDFLNHYRKLGITHFIFVDNGSTDGSLEYLLKQKDCYVFWTKDSFRAAGFGMAWINCLMEKYLADGQWCIQPDIDELLVYPHSETHALPYIIQYLEQEKMEGMGSYMLDMYPKNLEQQLAYQSGNSMLATAPYFYNNYHFYQQMTCPYTFPSGGIFTHFNISPISFIKTGVFKYKKGFKFLRSTHQSTPIKIANVSSVYLHFKMLGDFQAKAVDETKRKEHGRGGAMYQRYVDMYQTIEAEHMDLSQLDKSVLYQNSEQLVALGLLKTSANWEQFVANHKGAA
ncbi:tetratricopeptide repeat protein [Kingella negevensis]|uniref:tetratricopeptide repeat protein n=1 Tax=Kingella negevensis TaxID=1522312 RepID=UPI00254EA033|nr:tetratricopeptide repeat protein [Kingella negevensis]MDK4679417.1 tetratricopeptide repeat protein [Kingella negevensis]MDK4682865.1 tetratricopeptide repeat protein [Kingella negevensis]MDK4691062.1 tetratricopeptide repeat protein [Kingella negevensis]MDK4693791.1 tetratricopeptide repeat protein [Kingella negevensis]MDK4700303.1 tetratricopeptide repeat protein [Kingella negevensis]